jgi:hypothetical protein
VHPQGEIEVLADRFHVVAARLDDDVATQQTETARDDGHRVHRARRDARNAKRTVVFDGLEQREEVARPAGLDDAAANDAATVRETERRSDGDGSKRIREKRPHGESQCVVRDHFVRVHHEDKRPVRIGDRCVECVCAAAVLLVHHDERNRCARLVDPANRLVRQFTERRSL